MKKRIQIFLTLLGGSLLIASCSNDDNDNVALGDYDNGVLVLNEGGSGPSSAGVTFIGDNGEVEQDVFATVNGSATSPGSYLQSMFFDDTRAFIISGQANKITVVNRYTFEFIATVDTDFENPRYGAVINGKAYVTNYADYLTGDDDFLTVIDLSDYSTTTVDLGNWSEKIIAENGKLYIANGYYGSGTSVTVFNVNTNTADAVVELGFSPNSFEEENGTLYVLGSQKISKINLSNNQVSGTPITLPAAQTDARNLNVEDGKIYYTNATSVFAMNLNATVAPEVPLLTYESESAFGGMYGFAAHDGKIYVAEGGDFISDSEIYIYSAAGVLLDTVPVGVGPNGFYFND